MTDPETCHIRLAGSYATAELDQLIGALAPLDTLHPQTHVHLDLSDLERISAPSVAMLVACLLEADARGCVAPGSAVYGPRRRAAQKRLEELDVVEVLVGDPTRELGRF